jgi:hypothetical protein
MQSSPWIFLKSIRISFRAMEAAEIDAAGARQLARRTLKRATRDFLRASLYSVLVA